MNSFRKCFVWLVMMTGRLLKKSSFLIILACIILSSVLFAYVAGDDGIMKIALYSSGDDISGMIVNGLTKQNSVISYIVCESEEEAVNLVKNQKVGAAWIFDDDFEKKFHAYARGESIKPFVTVVEREDNISLMLSREKLFGELYTHLSYYIYEDFVREEFAESEGVSSKKLREFYDGEIIGKSLIQIQTAGTDDEIVTDSAKVLTSPLRGLLSLMVMLCGFASVLYFIDEREKGRYSNFSEREMLLPSFASCMGATLLSGAAMLISIFGAGLDNGVIRELVSAIAYVWAAATACLVLTAVFRRASVFGAIIPFLSLAMLALCPVFFNLRVLTVIRMLLPPYYYLMSVYNDEYILYMVIYGVVCFMLSGLIRNPFRYRSCRANKQ